MVPIDAPDKCEIVRGGWTLPRVHPSRRCEANTLNRTVFVPISDRMARRTSEHNLRQAISEILEQIYAIEYAMGLYYRKGSDRELARAQEDLEIMRAAVDRLGAIVGSREDEPAAPEAVKSAA